MRCGSAGKDESFDQLGGRLRGDKFLILAGLVAAWAESGPARAYDGSGPHERVPDATVSHRASQRIIKTFDFDEAKLGNYEAMPIGWRRVERPGYPRFAAMQIDPNAGPTGPAFRLNLAGGATAAEYLTRAIDVHPSCDYEISASIRTDRLPFAVATLEAFYLDHALREIPGSRRSGRAVRGSEESDSTWSRVTVRLSGGVDGARWMGLACAVRSDAAPADADQRLWPVIRQGVQGGAWFDDIIVTRVPRVTLEPATPSSVFVGRTARLRVGVAEIDAADLAATLTITDAFGRATLDRRIPVVSPASPIEETELPVPCPGRYTARVEVTSEGKMLASKSLPFVCVGGDASCASCQTGLSTPSPAVKAKDAIVRESSADIARGIGLILEPPSPDRLAEVLSLMDVLKPAAVKLPLWRADLSDDAVVTGDAVTAALVEGLHRRGILVIGVLREVPSGLAAQYDSPRVGLLDVLRGPAAIWRPYLALTVTRFGSHVGLWQIGGDEDAATLEPAAIESAATAVQHELDSLIGAGRLVAPRMLGDARAPAGMNKVYESYQARPLVSARNQLALNAAKADWLTVCPMELIPGGAEAGLAEFAQRVLLGRCQSARIVFVKQPWHSRDAEEGGRLEPTEEFPILAALGGILRGRDAVEPLSPGEGVRGFVLRGASDGSCSVVLWRDGPSGSGEALTWDIGDECQYFDATGRPLPLGRATGGRTLAVGLLPSILTGVSESRMRALARFQVEPAVISPGPHPQSVRLKFINPHTSPLYGLIRLTAPEGWGVSPAVVRVSLGAAGALETPLTVRVPSNQSSGRVEVLGRLEAAGDELDGMVLRAAVDVGSAALDVNVLTRAEGTALRVYHRVTNRSESVLNLRCVLLAPGRAEEQQMIRALGPGQSAVRAFVLPDAAALQDRAARVTVEQLDGPIRDNRLIVVNPSGEGIAPRPPAPSLVRSHAGRAGEPDVQAMVSGSGGLPSR